MSESLKRAYASAEDVPVNTIRLINPNFSGGEHLFVQGKQDFYATLETGESKVFKPMGLAIQLPKKGISGQQDLTFQMSNVSREAWQELKRVITSNKAAINAGQEPSVIALEYRAYLETDAAAPHGGVLEMTVNSTACDLQTATLKASFLPMADISFPRLRYYSSIFPGVRYA